MPVLLIVGKTTFFFGAPLSQWGWSLLHGALQDKHPFDKNKFPFVGTAGWVKVNITANSALLMACVIQQLV